MADQYITISKVSDRFSDEQMQKAIAVAQDDIGKNVVALFRLNYNKMNAEKTRGFSSPGFYERSGNSTYYTTTDRVTKIISDLPGILQRLRGGVITAKNVKYLTIPNSFADPAVYREASTNVAPLIEGLRFIPLKGDKAEGALVKGKGKVMQIYFWLCKSVSQHPNINVIPREDLILQVAAEALRQSLRTQLAN